MEIQNHKRFHIVLLVVALLAILFQAIGFFTQGWLLLKQEGSDYKREADIGLWTMSICYANDRCVKTCHAMSFEEFADKIIHKNVSQKAGADFLHREFTKTKVLATIAGLAAISGLLSTVAICFRRFFLQIQHRRLVCCLSWITSGFGMLFSAIAGAMVGLLMCFDVNMYMQGNQGDVNLYRKGNQGGDDETAANNMSIFIPSKNIF